MNDQTPDLISAMRHADDRPIPIDRKVVPEEVPTVVIEAIAAISILVIVTILYVWTRHGVPW